MSMTLQELTDWHAKRAGWTRCTCTCDECKNAWKRQTGPTAEFSEDHPFPPTLDGADASFPNAWEWGRTPPRGDWCAVSLARGITEQTAYTGDKPRDLYELSKLAWEQEASR